MIPKPSCGLLDSTTRLRGPRHEEGEEILTWMAGRAHGWAGMHLKGRHLRTFCRRVVRIVLLVAGNVLRDTTL